MERNKRGLSPRQIINRYKKGVYTDACADAISAAVSASDVEFECAAIPVQRHWIEETIENIGLCFQLSKERDKADEILTDIGDEHARSLLIDLSTPDLWNAIIDDGDYFDIIWRLGFNKKYRISNATEIIETVTYMEREALERLRIDKVNLTLALRYMIVKPKE